MIKLRYYISDCHFGHNNVIGFDKRPFPDVVSMDTYMIAAWNNKVTNSDEVIMLGDFSFMDNNHTQMLLSQLKGRITLVRGNHDRFARGKHADISRLEKAVDFLDLADNNRRVICSHYPMLCYPHQYRGAYMLFGHIHDAVEMRVLKESVKNLRSNGVPCRLINCFCMYSGFVPLTLDEWLTVDKAVL